MGYTKVNTPKLIGLMFQFKKNRYYIIEGCYDLHTFFCFRKMDIYWFDSDGNIIKRMYNVSPFKCLIKSPKETAKILEILV